MRLIVYIDGFSFYYGVSNNTPYKWCDLFRLSQLLFPKQDIESVKLFSGRSKPSRKNPKANIKQDIYFRALRSNPRIEVFAFKNHESTRKLPIEYFYKRKIDLKVKVHVFQEKRVDTSLSINMLLDAYKNLYDEAVLISNDTDFIDVIEAVRYTFNKPVIFVPTVLENSRPVNVQLMVASTRTKSISRDLLAASQLPEKVVAKNGKIITKPTDWN